MNNIKILSAFILVTPLIGCSHLVDIPSKITPQDMVKYQNPESLITQKRLNGADGTGKDFILGDGVNGYKEAFLPYSYMNNLCKSSEGVFKQLQKSSLYHLNNSNNKSYKTTSSELSPYIGTFECISNNPWFINIKPISSRMGGLQHEVHLIKLQTQIINKNQAYQNIQEVEFDNQAKAIYQRNLLQYEQQKQQQKIDEQQRFIAKNRPTPNDIGHTVCNDTILSVFTEVYVFGEPHFRKQNGTVIATIEGFSNDKKNIKINIKGYLSTNNLISSGPNVLYNQIPLVASKILWEKNENWFKCNY